ncbi:PxKF domain-containing protein [Microbacterium terrisoli]|uniref:PxKF domain-containing protein n=1 Tax=Microbacterium terrisoli TaxID=3242192 RepID=UPI0028043012|nr:PxKF domain-containing protein [Microbacterium protaetiae]
MSSKTGSAGRRTSRPSAPPRAGRTASHAVRTTTAFAAVAGLAIAGLAATATPAAAAPTAANTIVVHADQPFRSVSHVASGSLYGLANATTPSDDLVQAIKPSEFVMKPIGGTQQPTGDIGQTWQKAANAGATVVDRLSDYYPGWPYRYDASNWDQVVTQQIQQVQATGMTNLASYAIWNEPDGTWKSENGTFEDFWTHTYRLIRSLDSTTPIQGPSFSDNIGDMQNFLQHAVATNTVPDILAWHELITSSKIAGDVAKVEAMEDALGIARRPIDIEEYAAPAEVGIPGSLVGYIAKFERLGIHTAELPFWNQSGALGDLLTGQGGSPNGAYWLYKWYADMAGDMVTTTPPGNNNFDAAASVTSDKEELDVITGGTSGPAAIKVTGLDKLALGSHVNVKVEYTPTYGRTVAVAAPITISNTTYHVADDGSINVPIAMNPAYGYHVVVTPAGHPASLSGTYTIANLNSGLQLTAGDSVHQQVAQTSIGVTDQTWKLVPAGSGLYKIVSMIDGRVLDVQGASTANGASAVLGADSGADSQRWQLMPDGKGHDRLANYGTGLVLAVNDMSKTDGAQVIQWTDGSITSGCTATGPRQPGKIGSALSFCNSNAYATLPTGAVSSLTGDYTVSTWVNPASNASWQRVFDIGSSSNASMFLTVNDGTELRYAITTSGAGGEQRLNSTNPKTLPLGQWSLVTITVAGTTGTMYVNGQVVATNTAMTVHPSAFGQSTRNYLGKSQYNDPALNGALDDFNIYNRALSPAEIATLATGQPGAGNVVHYAFDEPGGSTLVDSSGAGRNGTIVAATGSSGTTTATDAATADHFWTLTRVDVTAPVVALTCPSDAVVLGASAGATWTATDETDGSGLATPASGSIALDTSSVGSKTVVAPAGTALDNTGNTSVAVSCTYSVVYAWSGLTAPVNTGDVVNSVKAGSAVPVGFSLAGDQGTAVLAAGSPSVVFGACSPSAPVDTIEQTVTAGASGLQYDPASDQYTYVWKTNKSWSGTCATLSLTLDDGTTHTAVFSFVK